MMIDPVAAAGMAAEVLGQWRPHLTAALRLGTAGLAFGIAVHRTARYIRRTRNPHRNRRRRRSSS
jgi:hypothetical protein